MLTIFEINNNDFDELGIAIKNNTVYVKVNKNVFRKETITSAAYSIQEFANVILDETENYLVVALIPQKDCPYSLKDLAFEFNNRLINYENYFINLEKAKEIKEKVLQEVYSQIPSDEVKESEEVCDETETEETEIEEPEDEIIIEEDDDIDINDIVIPWEDKFKDVLKDKNDLYLEMEPKDVSETSNESISKTESEQKD